jgi:dihydropteroate synthase
MELRLRNRTIVLAPGETLVMGIVNIGDDSVADSLSLHTLEAQLEFAMRQHEDGAHLIDIGVQSGRTDTPPLSEDEEIARFLPLIAALVKKGVIVSVDAWRPRVVEATLEAGASLINDVSGLADSGVADLVASSGAGLVIMHTRAAPKVEHFPGYDDPMLDVIAFLEERIDLALAHGVAREQLVIDPGLDFAKTPVESVAVLRRLAELERFARPVLLAVSRKYFAGMITGKEPEDRLAETLAAVEFGVSAGARLIRVHDVARVSEFLCVRFALHDEGEPQLRGDANEESLKWLAPK